MTTEAVQLIYQLVQRQKCPNSYLDDIELWDKKILPNAVTSQSYCQINQENWDGIAHELHSWMREYREDTTME